MRSGDVASVGHGEGHDLDKSARGYRQATRVALPIFRGSLRGPYNNRPYALQTPIGNVADPSERPAPNRARHSSGIGI